MPSEKNPPESEIQSLRVKWVYIFLAFLGLYLFFQTAQRAIAPNEIPYSQFQEMLRGGQIEEVTITENQIQGTYRNPETGEAMGFVTNRIEPELAQELQAHNVEYRQTVEQTFFRDVLVWTLPFFLILTFWIYLGRKMMARGGGLGGGALSAGKSKAKLYVQTDVHTTFDDVAGAEEAKEELKEIIGFLKEPERYSRLGGRMPKGVLLVGPPGTGKTLMAKAVAGEAQSPFFSISGSEFVEMFVGVGAARVRDLFEQAKKNAPCIIFIDELDSLGKARSGQSGMGGGHDEKEQTLNQLLAEMDGFDTATSGVVILAATNRPEILDPALLRAGRFDRQVLIDRPDRRGREAILKVHTRKVKLSKSIHLEKVASITSGFTGADLANLVNEAALIATRRDRKEVEMDDFTAAMERIVAGLEKKNCLMNEKEKEVVAYHEMGHALVATALPGMDFVHKISIIPRGIGSLGYTIQRPTEDRYLMTKEELQNKMAVLMGGRTAELLQFKMLSTGAADDLARATDIARSLVTRYGMIEELGHVVYDRQPGSFLGENPALQQGWGGKGYSESTSQLIDQAVKTLMDNAFLKAKEALQVNFSILEKGAKLLLEKETLSEEELIELFSELKR
jgi:cell division protease FtsH